jgi:hypothetical protein
MSKRREGHDFPSRFAIRQMPSPGSAATPARLLRYAIVRTISAFQHSGHV